MHICQKPVTVCLFPDFKFIIWCIYLYVFLRFIIIIIIVVVVFWFFDLLLLFSYSALWAEKNI